MAMNFLPFDELNAFRKRTEEGGKRPVEDIVDEVLDILLLAYANGANDAADMLGIEHTPNAEEAFAAATKRTKGETFEGRIFDAETVAELMRIAETEAHRCYAEAAHNEAVKGGATSKTWSTMMDDRVRDTHSYLEGVSVPMDAEFYTSDGDHALYPGGFESAENNVNCRCLVYYK